MMKTIRGFSVSIFLIFLIPTILVGLWFKNGYILGTGESGLPFYNLNLQFNINKDAWASYTLGHPINIGIAAKPTYWFLAQLQNIGIPGFLLQVSFFWLSFIISGLSIYFISKELFPKLDQKMYLLAPLFYWFNPFSLVNVWNRFLNNFIVFYALLPLAIFLFLKGIRTKQYTYIFLIGLVSAVLSYAQTSIAFDILLWGVFAYTTLFYSVLSEKENKFFVIKFFIFTLIFWVLTNFWWISQVLSYIGSGSFALVTSSSFIASQNYYIFNVLSERLGNLIDLFRFKHTSFFSDTEYISWVNIYQFPVLIFFEFLVAGMILLPIIIKRKEKEALFLGGLFLLSVFFTKGNNPPLGEIFEKAFVNFSFLQVFRNPFEKIGFILPLSAAPLFCLGASLLIEKFVTKWRVIIYLFFIFWLFVIWGGPFWSSLVFTGTESPTNKVDVGYQVNVPKFYKEASDWLLSQGKNFRLVVFPIGGEGITNLWPKGYSGVELSNQLLPATSISFNTNIPFYDQVSNNLERIFLTKKDFPRIMDVLNSKYIMVRSDIDWRIRNMRNPHTISNRMGILESSFGKFGTVKQFDDLSFWQYSNWKDQTVYPAKNLIKVSGPPGIEDVLQIDYQDVLYNNGDNTIGQKLIKSQIIHPSFKFELGAKRTTSDFSFTNDLIFPAVKILPSDKLYPLILFKEKIEQIFIRNKEERPVMKISLLGKRLMEAEKEFEKNNFPKAEIALDAYNKKLREVIPQLSDSGIKINDKSLTQEELYSVFRKHAEVINKFKNLFPEEEIIETSNSTLKEVLIEKGIQPFFGYIDNPGYPIKGRVIYQFSISQKGNYELLIDAKSWDKYFKISFDEPLLIQVDKELTFVKAISKKDYISLGFFNFEQGKHEIAWNTPEEVNLVETPSEFTLKVDHGAADKSFAIHSFDPYSRYILSFNYLIKRGSGLQVSVEQNNEKYKKDKVDPRFLLYAPPDSYNFTGIKQFSQYFIPYTGADSAKVVFRIRSWNNCEDAHKYIWSINCKDEQVRQRFDLPTEISISNVILVKLMTEAPFLIKENKQEVISTLPRVSYTKINEGGYKVRVEDAKDPFILVLSQLFDPGWRVYSSQGKEISEMHFLANTYANGWVINKTGTYDLSIKFIPQEILQKGEVVSALAVMAGMIFLGWRFLKK